MYLFSRSATLRGDERRSMAWAAEMTAYVNDRSDHDVTCWRASFGQPLGTVAWTTWAETQVALVSGFAALVDDDGYFDKVSEGREVMAGPPIDRLRRVIHGERSDAPPPIGAVTTMTTAVMANGHNEKAVHWGIEMASFVEKLTHLPTVFMADAYGTFGQVTWITGAPDLASAEAAEELVNTSHDYITRVDEAEVLFVPGSGRSGMFTRIA